MLDIADIEPCDGIAVSNMVVRLLKDTQNAAENVALWDRIIHIFVRATTMRRNSGACIEVVDLDSQFVVYEIVLRKLTHAAGVFDRGWVLEATGVKTSRPLWGIGHTAVSEIV